MMSDESLRFMTNDISRTSRLILFNRSPLIKRGRSLQARIGARSHGINTGASLHPCSAEGGCRVLVQNRRGGEFGCTSLLKYMGFNFSVTVWVGFIALFGTAVQTGVVMVIYLEEAVRRKVTQT